MVSIIPAQITRLRKIMRFRKTRGPVRIDLEALAPLWTEPPGETFVRNHPSWAHADIDTFYQEVVAPQAGCLGHAGPVIDHLLDLLDRQGDRPSCPDDPEDSEEPILYAEISLLDHTLLVTTLAMEGICHRPDFRQIVGRYLVICLGHCLGLLSGTSVLGNDLATRTLQILDPMIADMPDKSAVIRAIQDLRENNPKSEEGTALKRAIYTARKKERETAVLLAKVWGRNGPTKETIIDILTRELAAHE